MVGWLCFVLLGSWLVGCSGWLYRYQAPCIAFGTLYELVDRSNGAGPDLIVGWTRHKSERRAVVKFDVAGLAQFPLSNFVSATMYLTASSTRPDSPVDVDLHPLSTQFGHGVANATDTPGQGAPAQIGDTTWFYAVYNHTRWTTDGGDFVNPPIASQRVGEIGNYAWSSSKTLAEVLVWLGQSSRNCGWLLKTGDGFSNHSTTIIFNSAAVPNKDQVGPRLVIVYQDQPPWWVWLMIGLGGLVVLIVTGVLLNRLLKVRYDYTYVTRRDLSSIVKRTPDVTTLLDDPSILMIPRNEIIQKGVLGSGASGVVLKAVLKSTGQEVAVKRLKLKTSIENMNEEEQNQWLTEMKNFTTEVKIMSTTAHPNILPLLGICIEDSFFSEEDPKSSQKSQVEEKSDYGTIQSTTSTSEYHSEDNSSGIALGSSPSKDILLILPYMGGGSLAQVLFKDKVKWDFPYKVKIAREIAYGMHHLHSLRPRIIHRDLKSDNILISTDGVAKIADFGLSRLVQKYSKTMTTSGTPHYLAPECLSSGQFSEKSDVYAYGIILYEIYCGKRPYPKKSAYQVMLEVVQQDLRPVLPKDCPSLYADTFIKCVDKKPEARPSFKVLLDILDSLQRLIKQNT